MRSIGKVSYFIPFLLASDTDNSGIRRAILSGDIDQALEVTHAHFPTVLAENPEIVFRLKCRKWVELMSKTTELENRKAPAGAEAKSSNGLEKSAEADDDFAQDMELDEHPNGEGHTNGAAKSSTSENVLQYDQLMIEAMQYGQELQREYRDEDGDYAKVLQDIFSLVAYNDPKGSVHGHLLDPSGRVTVAEELNSAILGMNSGPDGFFTWLTCNSFPRAITFRCVGDGLEANRSSH